MSVYVHPISPSSDQLRQYVQFGIDLYKGNSCYVPPLVLDDVRTLSPDVNPAFDFCDAQSFMAYRDGEPVGTITAIINKRSNEASGKTEMIGPMGFSDMDHEGMLIEGFDELGTMATIYNYPYYPLHMERMGFEKDADWVEYRITIPDAIPEKYSRIAAIAARKYGLKVLKYTSRKRIKEEYGRAIFELINEAYSELYGYCALTDRQIDYYIDLYIGILRLEDVCLVVDAEGTLVALGISMPSLSRALQKSRGRMFPFGWYHLLRAIQGKSDIVDLLLVAVKPEYQGKGVNAMLFVDLIPHYVANGYKFAESNVELEGNESVQRQWEYFERRQHRRRRAWRKKIGEKLILP